MYVSSINTNTIEQFTPGGVAPVFSGTGLNGPRGLAFKPVVATVPVPEPAQAALLALGLGEVGLPRRRRAR